MLYGTVPRDGSLGVVELVVSLFVFMVDLWGLFCSIAAVGSLSLCVC